MSSIKIISGHTNPGGSTVANINLCNLFNDNGLNAVFYGPHDWHLGQCRADKTENLVINNEDYLVIHYLVMPVRPSTGRKVILSCHEKHNYPVAKIERFWDEVHFVSVSQRDWHQVEGVVIPNRITQLESRVTNNGLAGVIGSIHPHKHTHVSIQRALDDGYRKVLVYGEISDPGYYTSHIREYIDYGKAQLMRFEDDMQKMYDSVEAVYHSSESETFNYIRVECMATGTHYYGTDTADPHVDLYSDDEILDAWLRLLEIR